MTGTELQSTTEHAIAQALATDFFADIDREFARWIARQQPTVSPWLKLIAALVSRARGEGHACLDLAGVGGSLLKTSPGQEGLQFPALDLLIAELRASAVVTSPGGFAPLVLDAKGRLYLHRYWRYETNLAQAIRERAPVVAADSNAPSLRDKLDRLFPSGGNPEQCLAAATALERSLCVITGGPGTGKTHTAGLILALLLETAPECPPRIGLCAPTGKAATRLLDSIHTLKPRLPVAPELLAQLPAEAFTLHRLLGIHPVTNQPRHHRERPLPFDVVVLDEASMVDLALMAKLFDALPSGARLVLLGDKDQLASVEAGAVLGDICHGAATRRETAANHALTRCIVQLDRSHRFADASGIGELGRAINAGSDEAVVEMLRSIDFGRPGVRSRELPTASALGEAIIQEVHSTFAPLAHETDPKRALQRLGELRILCALRRGPYGVETINRHLEQRFRTTGEMAGDGRHFAGRPVLVTRNDPALRLYNGDLGIILPDPDTGALRAWFDDAEGGTRSLLPARLPEHETAYAMTVHKSQGSEFDRALMILPERDAPVLTRELLYTGVTRARKQVEIWCKESVLRTAVSRRIQRNSGLRDALWPAAEPDKPANP